MNEGSRKIRLHKRRDASFDEKRPSVLAVGTFDGLHLGHRALLEKTKEIATDRGLNSAVLTFEPHPMEVLAEAKSGDLRLSPPREKMDLLLGEKLDALALVQFSSKIQSMDAETFAREYFLGCLNAEVVCVGYNFHFGVGGVAGVHRLRDIGGDLGFSVEALEAVEYEGRPVSSSRIREELSQGRVDLVHSLLGRPYQLKGSIVRGEGRGRKLGFPTANLSVEGKGKLLPAFGVYLARVDSELSLASSDLAFVSIGLSPTFGPRDLPRVEVFIPDFDAQEELYGCAMGVSLLEWIRPELCFPSVKELLARMKEDLAYLYERAEDFRPKNRNSQEERINNERSLY